MVLIFNLLTHQRMTRETRHKQTWDQKYPSSKQIKLIIYFTTFDGKVLIQLTKLNGCLLFEELNIFTNSRQKNRINDLEL